MKTDAVYVSLDGGADLKVRDSVRVGRSGPAHAGIDLTMTATS